MFEFLMFKCLKKKKLEKIWVNLLTAVGVVVWTNSISNATYTEMVTKAFGIEDMLSYAQC